MKTWEEVKDVLRSNYKVCMDDGDCFGIFVQQDESWEQPVLIARKELAEGIVWLDISSPATTQELDPDELNNALEFLMNWHCGGLIKNDASYFVRHSMPMEDLSLNVLVGPLLLVAGAAYKISQTFIEARAKR